MNVLGFGLAYSFGGWWYISTYKKAFQSVHGLQGCGCKTSHRHKEQFAQDVHYQFYHHEDWLDDAMREHHLVD